MKTNFEKTEETLGAFGVAIQEANRYVILIVGAIKSPIGLAMFILVTLCFGSLASAYGYADLMYISRLQTESGNLKLPISSAEVIAAAHDSAFWNGLPLMFVVGGIILVLDLFGLEKMALAGAVVEFMLGSAGFIYRAVDMDFSGIKFIAMIICGSVFIAASPLYMHLLAKQMHEDFSIYFNSVQEKFNQLLQKDFEELLK